jgi:hypothetical protein
MSLDFDRSPDGEPLPPAGQAPVPAQQAPATADQESTLSPSFTPKHAAGQPADDELADHELADDELADDELPDDVLPAAEPVLAEPAADDELADDELADEHVLAEPATVDEPVAAEAVPAAATASEATAYHSSAAPVWDAAASLDGPLLSETDELHASWQRIQGAFIDDPREAVADAAGLIEHVGQLLAAALRQRQQQLRALWDRDGMPDGVDYADSGSPAATVSSGEDRPAADGGPDTEQLRLLIRRYRALFNELCRP